MTCRYRCGDQCAHQAPNRSGNAYFGDVVQRVIDRRGVLRAGAVLGVGGAVAGAASGGAVAASGGRVSRPDGLGFTPVEPNSRDAVVVPEGYEHEIVIRWGDPVVPGAPEFDFDDQTPEAQERQFGYNNDFCALLDVPGRGRVMVNNHEYTSEEFMFSGYDPENPTERQVRTAWAAHGLSVVAVKGRRAPRPVPDRLNRRITLTTEFAVDGPAAGSDFLRTPDDPGGRRVLGTMNNCSGGVTPWGTILSGEENVHFYFANADAVTDVEARRRLDRYGFPAGPTQRKWERFDSRWDLARQPNEANRFGWIVEIDPSDPDSTPVKHTALGRLKHEGANVRVAEDGRVVAYMGDDEAFEYLYKFVSDGRFKPGNSRHARRHNMRLLESGTLYVARFDGDSPESEIDGSGRLPSDGEFDGRGEWIPLVRGDVSLVPGMTAQEVLVFTRLAADTVGATAMDRPEDVQPHPGTGRVYCALTKNPDRGVDGGAPVDEVNPRAGNKHGQVLELSERAGASGPVFVWQLLLVCGDPDDPSTYFAGFDGERVSPIACPDNVAFDHDGNLWITTDSSAALGANDGLYAVPLEGPERGHVQLFATVPRGGEACGPIIERDLVLVSAQHPGEVDGADADDPASNWPDGGDSRPRPSVVAIRPTRASG